MKLLKQKWKSIQSADAWNLVSTTVKQLWLQATGLSQGSWYNLRPDSSSNFFTCRFEAYLVFVFNRAAGWIMRKVMKWYRNEQRDPPLSKWSQCLTSWNYSPRAGQTTFGTKQILKRAFNGHLRHMFSNDLNVIFGNAFNSFKIRLLIDAIHKARTWFAKVTM